jgi:3-oxoadipate:acetyl-CoA acetyltransferase
MDLILNLTPTGMIPTKKMTPHVPITPEEIVADVRRCHEIGITMVHLHARDEQGQPTHRAEIYGKIIAGIRRFAPDLVICVSLSGRSTQDIDKRAEPLLLEGDLKPDMGSLTLSSLNFPSQASINSPETVKELASRMMKLGILPELEIFDLGMVNYAKYLIEKRLLAPPFYANLFLGNVAGAQLDLAHAGLMVRDLPADTLWSFGGIGDAQLGANTLAIATGGGVRVGLEDSIFYDSERAVLATNEHLVKRIHRLAHEFKRPVMKPAALRDLLGLYASRGAYHG